MKQTFLYFLVGMSLLLNAILGADLISLQSQLSSVMSAELALAKASASNSESITKLSGATNDNTESIKSLTRCVRMVGSLKPESNRP